MESITKYKLEYSVGGFSPNEMKSATSIHIPHYPNEIN